MLHCCGYLHSVGVLLSVLKKPIPFFSCVRQHFLSSFLYKGLIRLPFFKQFAPGFAWHRAVHCAWLRAVSSIWRARVAGDPYYMLPVVLLVHFVDSHAFPSPVGGQRVSLLEQSSFYSLEAAGLCLATRQQRFGLLAQRRLFSLLSRTILQARQRLFGSLGWGYSASLEPSQMRLFGSLGGGQAGSFRARSVSAALLLLLLPNLLFWAKFWPGFGFCEKTAMIVLASSPSCPSQLEPLAG